AAGRGLFPNTLIQEVRRSISVEGYIPSSTSVTWVPPVDVVATSAMTWQWEPLATWRHVALLIIGCRYEVRFLSTRLGSEPIIGSLVQGSRIGYMAYSDWWIGNVYNLASGVIRALQVAFAKLACIVEQYIAQHSCSWCGGPFNSGNCPGCSSVGSGNEFVYDPNPYSYNETPNFFNQPPHHQYETYSCELCGDTLVMGDEVISTTLARETDEFIKSSVDDLILIPRDSEVTSDSNLECGMPVNTSLPTTDVREENFDINSPLGEHVVDFLTENEDISGLPRHLVKQLYSHLVKNPNFTKQMSDEPLGDNSKPRYYDVTFSKSLFDFNDDYTLCYDNTLFDKEFEEISSLDP
nr:hypothetical protein [Tanacetum cinerariifolium]